jgi:aminoglycoside 2''-phosphotransferase
VVAPDHVLPGSHVERGRTAPRARQAGSRAGCRQDSATAYARRVNGRLAGYLDVLERDGQPAGPGARLVSGQFHDVVLAGDVAYRFPRDEPTRRALPARMALLAALATAQFRVAIPVPLDLAHLGRPLGSCYAAVSLVDGEPAKAGVAPAPQAEAALARELADLLDRLGAIGADAAVRQAVPAAGPDYWIEWAAQVRAVLHPLMTDGGRQRSELELAAICAVDPSGTALVHTDLGGGNLLLTAHGDAQTVTGVLDWDGSQIGNQASDLASLAATFGWRLAGLIDAERARLEGPMIGTARVIAATFALQQALPAALSGDSESLADGLASYRWCCVTSLPGRRMRASIGNCDR